MGVLGHLRNTVTYLILKYLQVSYTVFAIYLAGDTKWGLTCSQYLYLIQELRTSGVHCSSNKFIFSASLTSDTVCHTQIKEIFSDEVFMPSISSNKAQMHLMPFI